MTSNILAIAVASEAQPAAADHKSVGWLAGGAIAKPPARRIATRVSDDANKSVRQNSGPRPQGWQAA
jgi:hypothetical protein